LGFSKWPNLLDMTSLARSGSVMVTRGIGPNHVKHMLPCSRTAPWMNGATWAAMSWHRSGSGLDQASRLDRPYSLRSPVRKRYGVPRRPCARSARSRRRGPHHRRSSSRAACRRSRAPRRPQMRKLHGVEAT